MWLCHARQLYAAELRKRLAKRSGGQGVAGSNPAVPTTRQNTRTKITRGLLVPLTCHSTTHASYICQVSIIICPVLASRNSHSMQGLGGSGAKPWGTGQECELYP